MKDFRKAKYLRREVQAYLKKAIKGYIRVDIKNDTMYIDIISKYALDFTYMEYDITDQMAEGLRPLTIAERAINQYEKYILCEFFR